MTKASSPIEKLDERIRDLGDWRGKLVGQLKEIIWKADPDLVLEWKWDTSVWTKNGLVCAVSAFKGAVKMNFFRGAELKDPNRLINSGFTSKNHRAIDFHENDKINEEGIVELVKEAVALNS